jgi:hypothetical protein
MNHLTEHSSSRVIRFEDFIEPQNQCLFKESRYFANEKLAHLMPEKDDTGDLLDKSIFRDLRSKISKLVCN